jgi:hypothetical protein
MDNNADILMAGGYEASDVELYTYFQNYSKTTILEEFDYNLETEGLLGLLT